MALIFSFTWFHYDSKVLVWMPDGVMNCIAWLTVLCVKRSCGWMAWYGFRSSEWTMLPGATTLEIMGSNVALSRLSTVCIYPSAGWNLVSTIRNTYTCSFGGCPWWALTSWEKRDSSTCTTAPTPQSTMGLWNSFVVHIPPSRICCTETRYSNSCCSNIYFTVCCPVMNQQQPLV